MFNRNNLTTGLIAFAASSLANLGCAEMIDYPAKLMLNTEAFVKVSQKHDQRIMDAYQDISVEAANIKATFSLDVAPGLTKEDWDME